MNTTQTVYLMYDAEGALLYIGCTFGLPTRVRQHWSKPWWLNVARIDVEHHPSHAAGFDAEARLIRELRPLHNAVPEISKARRMARARLLNESAAS